MSSDFHGLHEKIEVLTPRLELSERKRNDRESSARQFKLHAAILEKNTNSIRELIAKGSDIDEVDNKGDAPFVTAIRCNNAEALKILIENRCDLTNLDGLNSSALGLASIYGHVECVNTIIDAGEDIDEATYFSHNSLMLSAFQGQYDVVKILLERGADPNCSNRHGMTALHKSMMVVDHPDEETRHKIVALLLRYGANPCQNIDGDDLFSSFLLLGRACPLSFAVATGYISLIRILLIAGHDILPSDIEDWKQKSLHNNICHAFYTSPQVTDPILQWICQPRSLLQISRSAIRKSLSGCIPEAVAQLENFVGKDLRAYLDFSDMDLITCEPAANRDDIVSSFPKQLNHLENNTLRLLRLITH